MDLLIKFEIIALLLLPFPMAILRKRGVNIEKPLAFATATLFSIFLGSYYLYLNIPKTLFSFTIKDWLLAIIIASLVWILMYPFMSWLGHQGLKKK